MKLQINVIEIIMILSQSMISNYIEENNTAVYLNRLLIKRFRAIRELDRDKIITADGKRIKILDKKRLLGFLK